MSVSMLINVLLDLIPCSLVENYQGFGESFRIAICRVGNKCDLPTMKMEPTGFFETLVIFYQLYGVRLRKYISLNYFISISKESDSQFRLLTLLSQMLY
jgi:hypothetical protein